VEHEPYHQGLVPFLKTFQLMHVDLLFQHSP
jgi:hypothetical protein